MRVTTAAVLSCLLCSCASPQDSYEARMQATENRMVGSAQEFVDKLKADGDAYLADYDRRLKTWKPQLAEYHACNRNAARIVASQSDDPISLAMAARNLCRADEANLRKAVYAAYSDNPRFGMEAMEKVRKSALENNAGEIVAYRARMSSPTPAPNPPKEMTPAAKLSI